MMFSASATRHSDLFAHRVSSTMDANRGVSFRYTGALSSISNVAAFKIDCGERLAIFGFDVFKKGMEAMTDLVLRLWRCCCVLVQVG